MDVVATLHQLGVALDACTGTDLVVRSPIDGSQLASLRCHTPAEVQASIAQATEAFLAWRDVPAPQRGALVRLFENLAAFHGHQARGEVQEMIDMCDFAVGLSR